MRCSSANAAGLGSLFQESWLGWGVENQKGRALQSKERFGATRQLSISVEN